MTSIINFCLETLPMFDRDTCLNTTGSSDPADKTPNYNDVFFIIESICVTWFTIEFIMRLVSCPSKWAFCKDIMNIFDVLAIVPFFVVLVVQVGPLYTGSGASKGTLGDAKYATKIIGGKRGGGKK